MSGFRAFSVLMLVGLCGIEAFLSAQSDEFPSTPFPRIETGMHAAMIRRLSVDAGERFLVTASDDKTARIWDLRTGILLRTLRPPQGEGNIGKLYAVAISPDGATVAVGGVTKASGSSIYLFDRLSGEITQHIDGLPNSVNDLSYSQDGRFLAAALSSNNGIRVYRTDNDQEAGRDTDYADDTCRVDFDRAGRLVTASYDGYVRLYSSTFRLLKKRTAPGGNQLYSARFSPDGSRVAVGFNDSQAVDVLSGQDLSFLYAPSTQQLNANLGEVAWSRDGGSLYAAGHYGVPKMVIQWVEAGRGRATEWPISSSTALNLLGLSGGRLVFASADPAVGVLDTRGQILWQHAQESLDLRSTRLNSSDDRLHVSPKGEIVVYGYSALNKSGNPSRHKAQFSIPERKLFFDPPQNSTLYPPRTEGLHVAGWNNTFRPTLDGRALSMEANEMSRTLAISKEADGFLLGTEFRLRLFNRQDEERWAVDAPGVVWDANLTLDGHYAVAALGDGTIRWYDAATGNEVLALFVHTDGKRWVAWTTEGFFDASPGGEALLGYHLNQGAGHAGEFVKVDQVINLFYRPDLIAQRLSPGGAEIIRASREKIGDIRVVMAGGLPPDLERLSPVESQSNGDFAMRFRTINRGGGVGRVIYRVDGVESEGREVGIPLPGSNILNRRFDLSAGRHEVEATVYNARNQVESRSISAIVNVAAHAETPSLYVVAVGISKYRESALNEGVRYAAADAKTVVERLQEQGRNLFARVIPFPLYDAQATRLGIEQAIAKVATQIHPYDVFVLYLAGHGTAFEGQYSYVPWEARYTSNDALRQQSLDAETLRIALAQIPAKKTLVLLDTCSSATFSDGRALGDKASIDRLARITGRATLAAATQTALEGVENHGVFTYAVLEALSKVADTEGLVSVTQLADYVVDLVPKITAERFRQEQIPMWIFHGQTFPIARKR